MKIVNNIVVRFSVENITSKLAAVMAETDEAIHDQLDRHGEGPFVSPHEILGAIVEELDEFKEAVHDNDTGHAVQELMDVAVAALWGVVSLREIYGRGQPTLQEGATSV